MDRNLKVKHLIYLVVASVFLGYFILRSSNYGANFMLPYENEVRRFLGEFFGVRPRTKEFLFLYPSLLFLVFGVYSRKLKKVYLLFVLIGLISVFNTYMHFHIPVIISVERTIFGLILGFVIGNILLIVNNILRFLYEINEVIK
jgi:hypothetical protein